MTTEGRKNPWRVALYWVAGACLLLALACIAFGLLGLLGVIADVGPAENRRMGLQLFRLALFPLGAGGIVLLVALFVPRAKSK